MPAKLQWKAEANALFSAEIKEVRPISQGLTAVTFVVPMVVNSVFGNLVKYLMLLQRIFQAQISLILLLALKISHSISLCTLVFSLQTIDRRAEYSQNLSMI